MESLSAFPDEEFNALNRITAIDEFNFTQQLQYFSFPLENDEGFSFINPSSFCHFPGADNGGLSHRIVDWSSPTFPTTAMGDSSVNVVQDSSENAKKRPRVLKDAQRVHKRAQNSKNNRKISVDGNDGESNTDGLDGLISCSSGDDNSDSNASQALNLNAKTRASRGAATDPQSLYARKRRERINERLRILQNLVPNGTKVDISTMLEEAVHYVKFLQLQIKLLSSDDLWMYAPIAYNGIEIDLDKISKIV